jgi:6-phosphogluconolactonase
MLSRRTFAALLAGTAAAPKIAWSEQVKSKPVFYASVGPELTVFDVDVADAALHKRGTVTLPANIQYAWPHPSKRYLYVVSSSGGPGAAGDKHLANAFRVDSASGALQPHGEPQMLPSRPIHTSVDRSGEYLLTAYNDPSNVTVHRIKGDGTLGDQVSQQGKLDTGIYAHQILATPGNHTAILVTRGNNATGTKPEDPGALKVFRFKDGALTNLASIAPGNGLGFGPRHLDFHPSEPWVYVSIERQNKLYVYKLDTDGRSAASRYTSRKPWPIRSASSRRRAPARSTSIPTAASSTSPTATRARSSSRARRCSTAARTTSRCSPSTGRPASRS